MAALNVEDLRRVLAASAADEVVRPSLRRAAVLVPIVDAVDLPVLFTKRAAHLQTHAGQVSFPGGTAESRDPSLAATALREAEEEIALRSEWVDVIGFGDQLATPSGFHVTPVFASIAEQSGLQANPEEVERIFAVPLPALLKAENWELRLKTRGDFSMTLPHFDVDGETIWGVTAFVLSGLRKRLLGKSLEQALRG